MAEKYGEVPPLFTKKWWEYFWDYYKFHVIVVAFIIVAVIITVVQVSNRIDYDARITFGSYYHITDQIQAEIVADLTEFVEDVNGDGEKHLLFTNNGFSNAKEQAELNYALETKFMISMQEDDSFIYIVDTEASPKLLGIDYCEDMYFNAEELGVEADGCLKDEKGISYGIPLKESRILKNNNVKTDDLYLVLRKKFKEDELLDKKFESALKLAKELIK